MLRNSWVRARQLGVAALLAVGAMTIVQTTALAGPSTQLAQASYNEATINNFVTAARQIAEPRLQAAESKEAAQKLVDEVRGLMLVAIKGVGFTQKEYAEIARTAQADPTLRARVEALITAP
jgi:hypothetical protein